MQNTLPKNHYNKTKDTIAYFCVPADFKISSLKKFADLNAKYKNSKIEEVYGSLPQADYGSGRSSSSITDVKFSGLKKYIKECEKNGIIFNYVFNANTVSNREFSNSEKKKIISFVKKLESAGIRRLTITLPSIVSLINKHFKDIDIVLSVVNNVTSKYQLKEFLSAGKIIRAYVGEEMNRKPHMLKSIVAESEVPIATIVNTFCLFECAYRYHHYNFMSFRDKNDNVDVVEYYGLRCGQIKIDNADEVIKIPWIRPSDIDKYIDIGVNWFKIAGREMIKAGANITAAVEIYMSRSYDGDLIDLLNNFSDKHYNRIFSLESKALDPYFNYIFNKSTDCSRDLCEKCGMCKKYSKYVKVNKKEAKKFPKFNLLK